MCALSFRMCVLPFGIRSFSLWPPTFSNRGYKSFLLMNHKVFFMDLLRLCIFSLFRSLSCSWLLKVDFMSVDSWLICHSDELAANAHKHTCTEPADADISFSKEGLNISALLSRELLVHSRYTHTHTCIQDTDKEKASH